ncbi:MAG: hypothetical protein Q3962_01575 [Corynebacterium sp.]|nr:hypothetical protein [Corynebacterium sp.]
MKLDTLPKSILTWIAKATAEELESLRFALERRSAEQLFEDTKEMTKAARNNHCRMAHNWTDTQTEAMFNYGRALNNERLRVGFEDRRFGRDAVHGLVKAAEGLRETKFSSGQAEGHVIPDAQVQFLEDLLRETPEEPAHQFLTTVRSAVRESNAEHQRKELSREKERIAAIQQELQEEYYESRNPRYSADPIARAAGVDPVPYLNTHPPIIPPVRLSSELAEEKSDPRCGEVQGFESLKTADGVIVRIKRASVDKNSLSIEGIPDADMDIIRAAIKAECAVIESRGACTDWAEMNEAQREAVATLQILWRGITGDGEFPPINFNLNVDYAALRKDSDFATVKFGSQELNAVFTKQAVKKWKAKGMLVVQDSRGEAIGALEHDIPEEILRRVKDSQCPRCFMPGCTTSFNLQRVYAVSSRYSHTEEEHELSPVFCEQHVTQVLKKPENFVLHAAMGATAWKNPSTGKWSVGLFITQDSPHWRKMAKELDCDPKDPYKWNVIYDVLLTAFRERLLYDDRRNW